MMKAPICGICLRSSILCRACQDKLESGGVSESVVKVSRAVFGLSDRFRSLQAVTIKNVIETENNVIIITEAGDAAKIIGKGGFVAKELSKALGKNVRVIEQTGDKREFIEKMIFPSTISSMNVVYTEGGEILKIVVSKRLPVSEESVREVVRKVFGQDIKVISE